MMDGAAGSGRTAPSLAGRFAAAIALTVGFYALALALAAALIGGPIYGWVVAGRGNVWITITALALGVSILVAIFPRRSRFEAPGLRLDRGGQPRLIELVDDEAKAMGEKTPDEVYATMEVNAAVTEAGRGRRVMIVGLPLLHLLSERGLRGVIAHELGHYAGGDTRLGPWIYRTREAIGRTIESLSDEDGDEGWSQRAVRMPFIWYGRAFMRITNAISRRQEFAADACAVQRAGRDVHVEALRRVHAFGLAFDAYWEQDVVPVLASGARPPLAEGFSRFTHAESIQETAGQILDRELAEGRTDPYDSHPALAERIAAVAHTPAGEPDDSPPAVALIDEPDALEADLIEHLFGPDARRNLEPIAWEQVAARVYVPGYEQLATEHAWVLEGVTFASLPATIGRLDELAAVLRNRERNLSAEEAGDLAAAILAAGGVLALRREGWTTEALPGLPVLCRRDDAAISPHAMVAAMRTEGFDAERYEAELREHGIAQLALDAPVGEPA
jgi:heat shock protein HtpX